MLLGPSDGPPQWGGGVARGGGEGLKAHDDRSCVMPLLPISAVLFSRSLDNEMPSSGFSVRSRRGRRRRRRSTGGLHMASTCRNNQSPPVIFKAARRSEGGPHMHVLVHICSDVLQ